VQAITTELLREKDNAKGMLRADDPYVLARGNNPIRQVTQAIDHAAFLETVDNLRYGRVAEDARLAALGHLADVVTALLGTDQEEFGEDVQYDLVTNPIELGALPFELARGKDGKPLFAQHRPAVILTRRVRHGYDGKGVAWWTKPRVLFVVASAAGPVPEQEHEKALRSALAPWIEPLEGFAEAAPDPRSVLTLLKKASRRTIREACDEAVASGRPYTHVHVLAHGCPAGTQHRPEFGVALHPEKSTGAFDPVDGAALAACLSPLFGSVSVVTLAACDSGNQTNTVSGGANLAHTLQSRGVPVVVASQFPLTFAGSELLTSTFYETLLLGTDVRTALHRTRLALYDNQTETYHDWASLVAYVQLPEDYHQRLIRVNLESEMAALRTRQSWADTLVLHKIADRDKYAWVADQLRRRIANLFEFTDRPGTSAADLIENYGLLGSAQKRLAELCFERGRACGDVETAAADAKEALEASLTYYEKATNLSLSSHWTAVQQLSLETVLRGKVASAGRWYVASEGAIVDRDRPGSLMSRAWACGSLAEIYLLAPLAGQDRMLAEAGKVLAELMDATAGLPDNFPIESTRRQLLRYVNWWTKENGFFDSRAEDLSADAAQLLKVLEGLD
jgi:hypothetical protein